jgi:HlyD family secretion protein
MQNLTILQHWEIFKIKQMKAKRIIFILAVVLASCSGNENLSDAYGNFESDDVVVSAEATGKILVLNIQEGQKLVKSDIVGIIDTTDLTLKKQQLLAQKMAVASKIENIRAQIEVQEQQKRNLLVDKARVEKMLKDGAATQKQLDDINGKIDLVNAQISSINTQNVLVRSELDVIKTQISQVEEGIKKCKIVNPLKGTVLEKYAEQGEITAFGKPVYKIADLDVLNLKVYVSGDQLPHIKLGQQTEVLIDDTKKGNRKLTGVVSWISSNAEFTPKIIQTKEERVNMVYAVEIRVKNDGSLKIGMPGEANF